MKNNKNKPILIILSGLFLNIFTIHCQTTNEVSLYNWFDKTVGKVNLDINKGQIYANSFLTIGNNNLYLIDNNFTTGSVSYNGQIYYETKLNYDIYRDILILNPSDSESIGISLNKEKVDAFSIYNQTFVKINDFQYNLSQFTTGYYEICQYENEMILYIKHKKNSQKKINDDEVYYVFKNDNTFYLDYKKVLFQIKGKSDLITIFPEQKKRINEFYSMNRDIKSTDPNQFMKNLIKSISSFISNSMIK